MRNNRLGKWTIAGSAAVAAAVFLAGCGKQIEVKITEPGKNSTLSVEAGRTVEDVLEEAQITVSDKDKVTPERKEKLEEPQEIVISRYAKVIVESGGESREVECYDGTVEDAVAEAGFDVGDGDSISAPSDERLADGMTITITQRREVTLKADGQKKNYVTEAGTVGAFLEEQGFTLDADDVVKPDVDQKLLDGADIVVKRVEIREETQREAVPFKTEKKNSEKMKAGEQKVETKGADGEKEIVYRIKTVDGKEKKREVVSEKEVKKPVTEVVVCGTKKEDKKTGGGDGTPSVGDKKGKKTVVSKQKVEDCDGSGHGYFIIKYDDGSEDYIDY